MLKGMKKHEDKKHGKNLKDEALRSINHKATQNKINTRTIALERSVQHFRCKMDDSYEFMT